MYEGAQEIGRKVVRSTRCADTNCERIWLTSDETTKLNILSFCRDLRGAAAMSGIAGVSAGEIWDLHKFLDSWNLSIYAQLSDRR